MSALPEDGTDHLSVVVTVRATPGEREAWRAAAGASGASLSDWVRARLAEPSGTDLPSRSFRPTPRGREPRRPAVAADPVLIRQVARIGNNLNQLARAANGGSAVDLAVLAELAGLREQLAVVLAGAGGGEGG